MSHLFHICVRQSWWVILFMLSTFAVYHHFVKRKTQDIHALQFRYDEYQKEKLLASSEKSDLEARILSHSDPEWVEMILMRKLGLVPEGFTKVHFTE